MSEHLLNRLRARVEIAEKDSRFGDAEDMREAIEEITKRKVEFEFLADSGTVFQITVDGPQHIFVRRKP